MKPLGFPDYVKLQMNARCVLSDSGTLTEEASILGFPAVMIRQAHERPEGMDETAVIMAGLKSGRIIEAIELAVAHHATKKRPFRSAADYEADNVSLKVARIILSYTDYVNRTVWRK
jgi:UDP-N-acetylglucosamine 2-epimerase (non-hydrolysing)